MATNQSTYLTNMANGKTSTGGVATAGQIAWAKAQLAAAPAPAPAKNTIIAAPSSTPLTQQQAMQQYGTSPVTGQPLSGQPSTGTGVTTATGTGTGNPAPATTGTPTTNPNPGSNVNVTGQLSTNGLTAQQIQDLMAQNSTAWKTASPEQQTILHNQNVALSQLLGSTYNSTSGTYSGGATGSTAISADQIVKAMQQNGSDWYTDAGNKTAQDSEHAQNEYLKQLFGMNGTYDSKSGVWSLGTAAGSGGVSPSNANGAIDNSYDWAKATGAVDQFKTYNQNTDSYAKASTDQTDPYWQHIRDLANSLGTADYNQKKTAYQALIDSLQNGQKSDMDAILANLTSDKNDLKDKTFQDWLNARQNLSNRGLTGVGAGFQQDADTRLQLNQQNALGKLMAVANQNIGKTNAGYSEKLTNAYEKQAGNTEGAAQGAQFQTMFDSGSKNLLEVAKMYAGLAGKQMPYAQFDTTDLLNTNYNYDKLATEDKQFYSKLGLDATKIMGYDAKGNPTLDMDKLAGYIGNMPTLDREKLQETIRHNGITEAIGRDRNAASAAKASASIEANAIRLTTAAQNAMTAAQSSQLNVIKQRADGYATTMQQIGARMDSITDKTSPAYLALEKQYEVAVNQYNNALDAFEVFRQSNPNIFGNSKTQAQMATLQPASGYSDVQVAQMIKEALAKQGGSSNGGGVNISNGGITVSPGADGSWSWLKNIQLPEGLNLNKIFKNLPW